MQESDSATIEGSGSVVQAPFLRFRWAFLLFVLTPLSAWVDLQAVDLVNPDQVQPFWDEAARQLEFWSTRTMLLILVTGTALSLSFSALRRWRQAFLTGFLGWFTAETIVSVLKAVVARPRPVHPEAALEFLRPLYERPDLKSFPSGHAAAAVLFALFVTFAWRSRLLRCLAWGTAFLVLADRLYLGAHYLSDVIFGAGLGWAAFVLVQRLVAMSHLPLVLSNRPQGWRALWLGTWLVLVSWVLAAPMLWKDALTGTVLDDVQKPRGPWADLLLEPILGPAMKLASLPDLRVFALQSLIWLSLLAGLCVWQLKRRSLVYLLPALVLAVLWVGIALAGRPGPVRAPALKSEPQALRVDLQSHIGDPVDGGMSLEAGLERFRKLGFDLVVPTWHNSWSQGFDLRGGAATPLGIYGAEWSAGAPGDTPLHLLVFNQRPEPADLAEIDDWRELIRRVNESGGVVLASHFWRGDAAAMPRAAELVAAGISGFEVAGRSQELRAEALDRLEEIRSVCRRQRLVATASSDFHGLRSANYSWNLLSAAGTDASAELWTALSRAPESIIPLVHESPLDRDLGLFLPGAVAWSYLRELGLFARGVWLAYAFLLAAILLVGQSRRRNRGETRG